MIQEKITKIISKAKPRKLDLRCSLENLMILEYFTSNLSEEFIRENFETYGLRGIIHKDYQQKPQSPTKDLSFVEPQHSIVAATYISNIQDKQSLEKAETIDDLKKILFEDVPRPTIKDKKINPPRRRTLIYLALGALIIGGYHLKDCNKREPEIIYKIVKD